MDWLWQGVLANWVYALLVLAGGAALALLKKRGSRWLGPALYFLAGCALVAVTLYAYAAFTKIPRRPPPQITPDNIEANIRAWLDAFGQSTKKIDDPSAYFTLGVTLENGTHILVARPKTLDRYILLQSAITFSPEDKILLEKLTAEERDEFTEQLTVEMNRVKTGYTMDLPLSLITLVRRVPITENLTEGAFMQNFDEVDSAKLLALATIRLGLRELRKSRQGLRAGQG